MLKIKKILRVIGLMVLMLLALSGIGIGAAMFPRRERIDNEVRMELVVELEKDVIQEKEKE